MNFQFTHAIWLWLLLPTAAWTLWLAWRSDASLNPWRRWVSASIRIVVLTSLMLAIAGAQWKRPQEGMNVLFVLDRSDSVPSRQQEDARELANLWAKNKHKKDKAGFLIFGSDAALESTATTTAEAEKIQAVVNSERSDIAGAIRLATAAFPESGQKKIVLFSDGNQNVGDAVAAAFAAKPLEVTLDAYPLGVQRSGDVSVQKVGLPAQIKKGQTFEAKIFANSDKAQSAKVRLFRNDQLLGERTVQLEAGKNLFTFPQTLENPDFYRYDVQIETTGDTIAQNNKASSFVSVRGDPRILIISAAPDQDQSLVRALRDGKLDVKIMDDRSAPSTLAEIQSFDAVFLSNVNAGMLGMDRMRLLESAVRDFGVGLVCIGGDDSYAAGSYRNTPLEAILPVDMELSSKKVLPNGALGMVMHGMEFNNGNQVSREIALAALEALGPQDELGVIEWDGTERWVVELQKVGDKRKIATAISGMNQGDMPDFGGPMQRVFEALKASTANLKHMIVFSDGDPGAPGAALMNEIRAARITVSTVMIGGHVNPDTMIRIAELGNGRFYDIQSPANLPQIFIKEAAVILKSAIFEEPFKPQVSAASELIRGIGSGEYPILRGYVASTAKPRAEVPLLSEKGDPVLAHWQFGLGRTVAFTSDAKSKWAKDWITWGRYQQFWSQVGNWALRRIDTADFNTQVSVENGQGVISVEALDADGNFRNFLKLRTVVASPTGRRQEVILEQTGPGRYEARFDTKEVGAYLLNLQDLDNYGDLRGSQILGASVNYSPEFNDTEPNHNLLNRVAEATGGRMLSDADNPFLKGRKKTFQPQDIWDSLLKCMVFLFVLDVGVRRVDIDREEWGRWWVRAKVWMGFGDRAKGQRSEESLGALLARRDQVWQDRPQPTTNAPQSPAANPDLFRPKGQPVVVPGDTPLPSLPRNRTTSDSASEGSKESGPTGASAGTTSRLLEAKRRAQKRK